MVGAFSEWGSGKHRFVRRSTQTYSTNVMVQHNNVTLPEDEWYAVRYYSVEEGGTNDDDADDFEPNEFGTTNCIVQT